MEFQRQDLHSAEKVLENMNAMNACGLRLTGSEGQRAYCEMLKRQIREMGLEVFEKEYRFDRWEATSSSLTVDGEEIHVSSEFPYSGLTGPEGVTGRLVEVGNHPLGFQKARGKIGVCHIKNLSKISSKVAFDMRKAVPETLEIEKSYRGPVSTVFVKTLLTFWSAKLAGMKGMVCIWEDMSEAMVEGQWLNFILGYLKVPMLWVNETEGKKLIAAAKAKKSATLTLNGFIEKDALTESFYTVVKGTGDTGEAIIVNAHTDGCNFSEENGGVAMLSMLSYFVKHPIKRNLIFVFVTGHFRLPKFRTGFDQATSRWLADNREVWKDKSGKHGGYKVVAGCAVEHLGCTEWKDVNGEYVKTNDIDAEIVYTGNRVMDDIYYAATDGRTMLRTYTLRGHNLMHFGEGQPLFNKKIPEIALVTAPDYLCAVDKTGGHHMDKFNLPLMVEQIETFTKCVMLIDEKSAKELGKPQGYSLGLGKLKMKKK